MPPPPADPTYVFLSCRCYVWPSRGAGEGRCGRCGTRAEMCGVGGHKEAVRVLRQWQAVYGRFPEPIGSTSWWELPAWAPVVRELQGAGLVAQME